MGMENLKLPVTAGRCPPWTNLQVAFKTSSWRGLPPWPTHSLLSDQPHPNFIAVGAPSGVQHTPGTHLVKHEKIHHLLLENQVTL